MRKNKWNFVLSLGLLTGLVLACKGGFTTAHISSLKISTDDQGKNEAKTFKPGDKVCTIAQISNNGSTVQTRFRVLYDDVDGQQAGTPVEGVDKTLDVEGDRPAIFWITLPPDVQNGRYRVEVSMIANGNQKDKKTATFDVTGNEQPKSDQP